MKAILIASMLATASTVALADVTVNDPWARATVPKQPTGAVYMKINSTSDATLLSAETPAAKEVQVHTMHMHNDVMRMREHGQLDVPAGKTVDLAPGGLHLMLLGLKKPLAAGETVPLKMTFSDAKGKRTTTVNVPVRPFGK